MSATNTSTSRCFTALGLILGAVACLFGTAVADVLYVVAMLQLVISMVIATRTRRIDHGILILAGLVGICYLFADLLSSDAPAYEEILPALFALMGTMCIVAGVGIVLRRRRNGIADGVVGDGLIVGLGSWILSWVVLVQPVLASSTT